MKVFLHKLVRRGFSVSQLRTAARIREAVEAWVLDKGYTRPLAGGREVAADIGVPADQLTLFIRKEAGMPLLSWRKKLRIREAQQLLIDHPELPLSVIGEMVGIDDKSNFRRQFIDETGMSPRQWRARKTREGKP